MIWLITLKQGWTEKSDILQLLDLENAPFFLMLRSITCAALVMHNVAAEEYFYHQPTCLHPKHCLCSTCFPSFLSLCFPVSVLQRSSWPADCRSLWSWLCKVSLSFSQQPHTHTHTHMNVHAKQTYKTHRYEMEMHSNSKNVKEKI